MKGPGWGNPSDPWAPHDAGLRETTANSIARWKRRIEQSAQLGVDPPHELALTGREAAQLRELATARGATQLASLLDRVVAGCAGPTGAAKQAVDRLSDYVRAFQSGAHPLGPAVGSALAPAPAPIIVQPPPMIEPRLDQGRSMVENREPSMLGPRLDSVQSIAEPPLLQPSEVAAKPSKTDATLMSAQDKERGREAAGAPIAAPRATPKPPGPLPMGGPPAPLPMGPPGPLPMGPAAIRPSARPPSRVADIAPPRPPGSLTPPSPAAPDVVGTFFGFRAFGRKSKAQPRGGVSSPDRGGILGLPGRIEPLALPGGPLVRPLAPRPAPRAQDVFDSHTQNRKRRFSTSPRSLRESAIPRWSYFLSGGIGLLAIATASIIALAGHRSKSGAALHAEPVNSPPATVSTSTSTVPGPAEVAERLTATVHKHGAETPELRALLDTQGRLALACKNDPASCGRGWTPLARDSFNTIAPASVQLGTQSSGPMPAWLQRLKMPQDFPVRDDPVLRAHFDFNTKNIAGRQRLQAKLFECAAYDDIFDSTLVKYGAPSWLTAVVYQESDCNPRATSEVGAKGLWQFMPESARAYGLRVVEGDVDERLNPIKSTEAAIHFLTDLQRKLGSWDLVLAAYNMGPFALLARLSQVGETAGFWDLAHAGLLPEETAQYVPAIEAYALVIQNLGRLQFSRDGKRLEGTSEIVVKPGTRLSLIARAASTTTLHVRELNPEFLRDVVPEGETTARVPDAEAHRAQAFFESWSPDDNRDTCVSEDFDWGAKQFDTSRFAKSCPRVDVSP